MSDRVVLVGQAPGSNQPRQLQTLTRLRKAEGVHDPSALIPTPNSSGDRLRILLGMTIDEYDQSFDRINVVNFYHGPAGKKGDHFDPRLEKNLQAKLDSLADRRLILLGRNVARVFGHRGGWLEIQSEMLLIPHTSGICMKWNDAAFRHLAALRIIDFAMEEGGAEWLSLRKN